MIVQCIARKVNGYTLSLLGIHTMVHVLCALIIYFLWWRYVIRNSLEISGLTVKLQKPLDIIEQTIIHRSRLEECSGIIALMLMGRKIRSMKGRENLLKEGNNVCVYNQIRIHSTATNGPGLDAAAPFETMSWSDNHGNSRFTTRFERPQGQADERHEGDFARNLSLFPIISRPVFFKNLGLGQRIKFKM